ncbi:MAG: Crp/Fnr family transcriptional regulator [Pirellulaceae bacterium]
MVDANIKLLRQMPVFGGLNDAALQLILAQSESVFVAEGDYFFREGDKANSLFVLQSGRVVVERHWHDKTVPLGKLGKGDCIGEMALIDLQARSASVRAEVDCESIEISLRSLHALYQQDLEQYAIIMMNMGREVSRRLRIVDDRLFSLEQERVK